MEENINNTKKNMYGFVESEDITVEQILNNLMDGTKNLLLKTQVDKPHNLMALYIIKKKLELIKLKESLELTRYYLDKNNKCMVSKGREGRKEVVKAIAPTVKEIINSDKPTKIE